MSSEITTDPVNQALIPVGETLIPEGHKNLCRRGQEGWVEATGNSHIQCSLQFWLCCSIYLCCSSIYFTCCLFKVRTAT